MKKLLTVLLAACIVLTALSCAQAQPLEELIVGIVRDEDGMEKREEPVVIPNMD